MPVPILWSTLVISVGLLKRQFLNIEGVEGKREVRGMGSTFAEKVLAMKSGRESVQPGEFVIAEVDGSLANDVTSPLLVRRFREMGLEKPYTLPGGFEVYIDHYVPAPTIRTAVEHKNIREFCKKFNIYFSEAGNGGHLRLPIERGHCRPGMLFVGADSHVSLLGAVGAFATGIGSSEQAYVLYNGSLWFRVPESIQIFVDGKLPVYAMGKDIILRILGDLGETGALYKAVEFKGQAISDLSIDGRIAICGLTLEMGGKIGVVEADEKVIDYMKTRTSEPFEVVRADDDAVYEKTYHYDVSDLVPQIAVPPRIDMVKPVSECEGMRIEQVHIGSCVNGGLDDLATAARVLKGRKIHPEVRCIIVPQSKEIYQNALEQGYIETFYEAGALLAPSGCGPCVGGHMGVMAPGERVVSTGCRNFPGRMGSPEAEIYVASPATAAASAIEGTITDPSKFF
jgi:3-isopropylmalate/(R)-2-methylmalate dehydratase large subunit